MLKVISLRSRYGVPQLHRGALLPLRLEQEAAQLVAQVEGLREEQVQVATPQGGHQ